MSTHPHAYPVFENAYELSRGEKCALLCVFVCCRVTNHWKSTRVCVGTHNSLSAGCAASPYDQTYIHTVLTIKRIYTQSFQTTEPTESHKLSHTATSRRHSPAPSCSDVIYKDSNSNEKHMLKLITLIRNMKNKQW